jgi:hypothetical protein
LHSRTRNDCNSECRSVEVNAASNRARETWGHARFTACLVRWAICKSSRASTLHDKDHVAA